MMQANLFQVSPESSPTPDCSLAGQQSGEVLKERGMSWAAVRRQYLLDLAKEYAVCVAKDKPSRTITIDDVFAYGIDRGVSPEQLGNAAGSVFRGPDWRWECVGFVKSTRPTNNARIVRQWRLR